jgi:hypothetical protein
MFRVVLLFTFLGPFIGGITTSLLGGIIASISLAENDKYVSVIEGVVASVFMSPIAGLFGYPLALMIGGGPALFSGILYGIVLKRQKTQNFTQLKRILIGGMVGFVVSLASSLLYFFFRNGELHVIFWYVCISTVASAFCTLLITNKSYLVSDR